MRRPATGSFETLLGEDLWVLATQQAGQLSAITQLTSLPSTKLDRASFLLEYSDGRLVKGRRVESKAQAQKIELIMSALEHSNMPTCLERHGKALLMEWVPGRALQSEASKPAFLKQIGALQGDLHRWPIPDSLYSAYASNADDWCEVLDHQINQLVQRDALSAIQAEQTRNLAFEHAPSTHRFVLCHGDLHPENIVLRGGDNQIFFIDNENVGIHSPHYDVLRTWHRWPLRSALWNAYIAGYNSTNNLADISQQFSFWAVFVLVQSALFRIEGEIHGADETLGKLKRLLDDPSVGLD